MKNEKTDLDVLENLLRDSKFEAELIKLKNYLKPDLQKSLRGIVKLFKVRYKLSDDEAWGFVQLLIHVLITEDPDLATGTDKKKLHILAQMILNAAKRQKASFPKLIEALQLLCKKR